MRGTKLLTSLAIAAVCFTAGIMVGQTHHQPEVVTPAPNRTAVSFVRWEEKSWPTANITKEPDEPKSEPKAEPKVEPEYISLGKYRLTAYCSCEKCCDGYAVNRPTDANGKPIVYTANMSIARQGVTVAADTSVLPFGTSILIDGHEYIVQDRGGAIRGNRIDVYFESHEEALEFGVQYKEIFMRGDA